MKFTGVTGRWYNIQASTNLITWTNIGNLRSMSQYTTFCDTNYPADAAGASQRFFRLQQAIGSANPILTLGNPLKVGGGVFNLPVSADGVKTFVVQFSPDLTNWTALSTNSSTNGSVLITDPGPASPRRFYRLLFP